MYRHVHTSVIRKLQNIQEIKNVTSRTIHGAHTKQRTDQHYARDECLKPDSQTNYVRDECLKSLHCKYNEHTRDAIKS